MQPLSVPTALLLCPFLSFDVRAASSGSTPCLLPTPSPELGPSLWNKKAATAPDLHLQTTPPKARENMSSAASTGQREMTCPRKPSKPQYLFHCLVSCPLHVNVLLGTLSQVMCPYIHFVRLSPSPCASPQHAAGGRASLGPPLSVTGYTSGSRRLLEASVQEPCLPAFVYAGLKQNARQTCAECC